LIKKRIKQMKKLTLTFAVCAAVSLPGCGAANQPTAINQLTVNTSTTKTAPTNLNIASNTTTASSVTGAAACDEYLPKVEVCLNKPNVPEATKAAYRQSLEQNRSAWKQAASTPQGKAGLETSCKMAVDSAKPFFDSCK
jgi:hypothetical protein